MLGFDALAKLPLTASAESSVSATLNATQDANTVSAAGSVQVKGDLSQTQAADSVASTGAVQVKGDLSQTQDADSVSAAGSVQVKGDLSVTQGDNTLSADGVLSTGVVGNLNITQDANSVSAAGSVQVNGALSVAQGGNATASTGAVALVASATLTQADNTVASSGSTAPFLNADLTQDSQTVTATAIAPAKGTLNVTQEGDRVELPPPFVVAPSYGHWAKTKNKNKPQAPKLPDPVQAGEVVIDEAVLRQMEEERLAALVLQKKAEALGITELLRATVPVTEGRVSRSITLRDNTFDKVETTPEVRRAVVTLFRPPPKPALVDPVRGSITLRALGPRRMPEPDIRRSKTISLRRLAG